VQKCDVRWLLLVVAAAILFSIFGLPYFTQTGHEGWAIVVYAFFAVMFLYGRSNRSGNRVGSK
jgi:hypothetical protein